MSLMCFKHIWLSFESLGITRIDIYIDLMLIYIFKLPYQQPRYMSKLCQLLRGLSGLDILSIQDPYSL